jgi:hypothetical protein
MKKKRQKKAQVTIFVVLGIVLLVMVLLILYVVAQISQMSAKKAELEIATNILDSATINYYVQTCLESSTSQAVNEIMIQGGTLYENQGGPSELGQKGITHIPAIINGTEVNVSYSIRKNNPCPVIESHAPRYPRNNTKLSSLFGMYESINNHGCAQDIRTFMDLSGFFGLNKFTRLCSRNSENTASITGVSVSPCYQNWMQTNETIKSIEEILENRTLVILQQCLNFQTISDLQGSNIAINTNEEPELKVVFNKNTFSVKATYPFTAQLSSGETTIIRHEFNYASPLRLVRLHNYLISLLAEDAKNINFNLYLNEQRSQGGLLTSTFPNINRYYDPNFEVEIIDAPCIEVDCTEFEHDRILIVKDKLSYIGGKPLTIATAIQNRRPALDLISQHPPEDEYQYHLFVEVGDELIIEPRGFDPDDRELTYKYEGWKETYDEICSYNQALQQIVCNPINNAVNYLTNSQRFQQTQRAVNYRTNSTDIGPHTVRVSVYDREGLVDYQDVRILVFVSPHTNITMTTPHQGMPENVTSIETPLTLSGSVEYDQTFTLERIDYNWTITDPNGVIIIEKTGSETIGSAIGSILLPQEHNNIAQEILIQRIHTLNLTQTGEHKVRLEADVKYEGQEDLVPATPYQINLSVKACIPHINASNPPYPYNTTPNIFQANSSCCGGNINDPGSYTLKDNNDVCFQETRYGEFYKLKAEAETKIKNEAFQDYPGYSTQVITYDPDNPNSAEANAVFQMVLQRKCDGIRGNICAGPLSATLTPSAQCLFNQSLDEQCQGPPIGVSDVGQQCVSYTTNFPDYIRTFEYIHEQEGATGICKNEPACSTIALQGYGDGGKYNCTQAYCANGGCTQTVEDYCTCDEGCGAECGYVGDAGYLWEGNICKFGTCNECELESQKPIVCSDNNDYCYNESYCHYGVACTQAGANNLTGNFCEKGIMYSANITSTNMHPSGIVNVCLSGGLANENACNQYGQCSHTERFFTCMPGGTPLCTQTGPRCSTGWPPIPIIQYHPQTIHEYFYPT